METVKPLVMVVDDNRITTKLLRRYLEANGYEVKEAYDGIDAIEKLSEIYQQGNIINCLVVDVMMPKMDGFELTKTIRHEHHPDIPSNIPIVLVCALNDVANQIRSIDAGADDFMSKPIEEKLLVAKVKLLTRISESQNQTKIFE